MHPPVARPLVPGAPTAVTAFVDVAVVPMDTERVLPGQTVLVQGGRITALGPVHGVSVPAGAVRIDGRGKYLIPGLGDCHGHIGGALRGPVQRAEAEDRLFLWLAAGVTTLRNLDHNTDAYGEGGVRTMTLDGPDLLRLKARAAAGELWSPRIYTAGQWAPKRYTGNWYFVDDSIVARWKRAPAPRLDSVAVFVAAYKAAGYDFIKVYTETGELFDSMAAAARRVGLPIVGHVEVPLERALQEYRSFEHMNGYWNERIAAFRLAGDTSRAHLQARLADATQRAGVWNCPTLAVGASGGGDGMIKALQDAGARLLLGTDAPLGPILKSVPMELETLVKRGLTPYQALVAGTRNFAVYFGTLDETGTVAAGKRADLVLLTGNPLENVSYVAKPAGVMIGGRWLAREVIDRRVAAIPLSTRLGGLGAAE
jgi:imidazolonepropionase-like amidohydrolase